MRMKLVAVCAVMLVSAAVAAGAQGKDSKAAKHVEVPAAPKPLLPEVFAGWEQKGAARKLASAEQADSSAAAALKEFGFSDGLEATYERAGEQLQIRALHFADASGAFGTYSMFRLNGWPREQIGSGAASDSSHKRVLFWVGSTVVDVTYSRQNPMLAGELRAMAKQIPLPEGSRAVTPPILADLPQGQLDPQTTHYAVGPAGYEGAGGVLPSALVGFDKDAETVTANYLLRSGSATLTLIEYPTPQMAAAQETRIRDYVKAGKTAQPAWPKPLADSDLASLEVLHSGPIVALVSGDAIPEESHKLIERVHFASEVVTLPQVGGDNEISKTSKLLLGIAALVGIGAGTAIVLGVFFGGFRAAYRVARGKPASSVYESDFTSLHLNDEAETPAPVDRRNLKG